MPDIGFALSVCTKMEIFDRTKQKFVFRFVNMYSKEKIVKIVEKAQQYPWWKQNTSAAFMKAVGEVNREEKEGGKDGRLDKTTS